MQRAAWFVDGSYVYKAWNQVAGGAKMDYMAMRQMVTDKLPEGWSLDESYFFNSTPNPPADGQNGFHRVLSAPYPNGVGMSVKLYYQTTHDMRWPTSMGGEVVIHPKTGEAYRRTTQKGVDVGLAFHLIRSQVKRGWKKLFLATGDGDYAEVIAYLKEQEDVDVVLIGTERTIGQQLMSHAREIIDLSNHIEVLRSGGGE